jgi:dihydroorotate dehydrogenase electron transfer subunit
MARVLSNETLSKDFRLMRARCDNNAEMGQFYMLRCWDSYPVLSRPVSVFDTDGATLSFLYKIVGQGTAMLAELRSGDSIDLLGPLGKPLPDLDGRIAMVGGGVGAAPLYLAARTLKKRHPDCVLDLYLGFTGEALLEEEFKSAADSVTVKVGGYITDAVNPAGYDHIFACGPEIMMRVLFDKCKEAGAEDRLIVSLESRMACGVGACLVCSCKTAGGRRKVCKDGPVFYGKEVFGI